MSTAEVQRRFLNTVSGWLVSLPHDLRVLFEAKDDPNLERPAREIAAGAIVYVLNADASPDDFAEYADDAILLHAALREIAEKGGEGTPAFRERFAEYYDTLDADLEAVRAAMGETYDWLSGKLEKLNKQLYKTRKIPQFIDDDESVELLYEDSLAFATDYPVDEDKLKMRIKKAETVLDPLRRKMADEKKKIA